MSEPAQNSDQHVAAISKERLLTLAVLVGLGIAVMYFYVKSNYAASDLERQNVELTKKYENEKAVSAELKHAELRRLEEETANVTAVQLRLADVDRAEAQLQELRDELQKWQTTEADLKEADLGRRVASSPDALKQYQALQTQLKPHTGLPLELSNALDGMRNILLKAKASPVKGYNPGLASKATSSKSNRDLPGPWSTFAGRTPSSLPSLPRLPHSHRPTHCHFQRPLPTLKTLGALCKPRRLPNKCRKCVKSLTRSLRQKKPTRSV